MKLPVTCLLIASAALLAMPRAHAQNATETAGEMASACAPYRFAVALESGASRQNRVDAPGATARSNFCWGAFATLQDFATMQLAGLVQLYPANRPAQKICLPPSADRLQLVKTFLKYVDKHPQARGTDFGIVVLTAMTEAYPCG